ATAADAPVEPEGTDRDRRTAPRGSARRFLGGHGGDDRRRLRKRSRWGRLGRGEERCLRHFCLLPPLPLGEEGRGGEGRRQERFNRVPLSRWKGGRRERGQG